MTSERRLGQLFLGFSLILLVLAGAIYPLDTRIMHALQSAQGSGADLWHLALHRHIPTFCLVLTLSLGTFFALFGRQEHTRRGGVFVLLLPLLTSGTVSVLKRTILRLRPMDADSSESGLRSILHLSGEDSMPSGHVATATVTVLCLFLLWRRRSIVLLALPLIPLTMWNRVATAVHHPSDVFVGAAVPFAVAGVVLVICGGRRAPASFFHPLTLLAGVLLLSAWVGRGPPRGRDPISLHPLDGLSLEPQLLRTFFEPFVGPALHLAQVSGLKPFVLHAVALFVVLLVLVLLYPRFRPFRVRLLLSLVTYGGIVGALFFTGSLPPDRFSHGEREGFFVDLHTHGSDPVDGSITVEGLRSRQRGRGVPLHAVTNHDASCPDPQALPGLEWSGFRHAAQPFLHLLILFGEPERTLQVRVPHLVPGQDDGVQAALRAIQVAKAHGSLVVVAHYPATRTAMERAGLLSHLPTIEQLVEAHVDGFEVANRSPSGRSEDQEFYSRISALCKERGLLRIAVSDDHGIPAGSPCITWVEGTLPQDQGAARAFVETALRERRGVHPVVFPDRPRPVTDPPGLDVLFWCHRYLGSLTLLGRLSWLLWGASVYMAFYRRRAPAAF